MKPECKLTKFKAMILEYQAKLAPKFPELFSKDQVSEWLREKNRNYKLLSDNGS